MRIAVVPAVGKSWRAVSGMVLVVGAVTAAGSVDNRCDAAVLGAVTRAGVRAGPVGAAAAVVGVMSAGGVSSVVGGEDEVPLEVSAPPELRITTSGATVLVRVVSVGDGAAVVVPVTLVVDSVPVVDVGGVDIGSVVVESDMPVESGASAGAFAVSVVVFSESGVAHANPGVVATAIPTPSATANAPIRPM
jgi:hypothetical protein